MLFVLMLNIYHRLGKGGVGVVKGAFFKATLRDAVQKKMSQLGR